MTINNFIPTVWSARILAYLDKAHVYAACVNRDYEGEIQQQGDTVKINQIGPVTIGTYIKNTDIGSPETLTDAQQILTIDQAKYFNFAVDDVDKAQTKPKVMDAAMGRAAYGLNDNSDNYIGSLYTGVDAGNLVGSDGTPISLPPSTPALAYEQLVSLAQKLDESSVPQDNRWCVVPPWFYAYLRKDQRFVGYGTQDNMTVLRTGRVGDACGFSIYMSNNVPNTTGTKYKIMAGHPMAIAYAEQIVEVEAYRPEKRFADAVKGLLLFGSKLIIPKATALLTANPS